MNEQKTKEFGGLRISWGYKNSMAWKEVESSKGLELWRWDFKHKKYAHVFLEREK